MSVLSVLAAIIGIVGGFAMIPQTWKIYKRKSAKDISLFSHLFLAFGSLIWFLYGMEIISIPIMVSEAVGGTVVITIIIGWFLYGR
jgi:MtN3 and saliva related transmembrane protein